MKKFILITLLCALTVFACNDKDDDDDPEQAEYREATITLNFDTNAYTIKVSGTLLASEWNGVPGRVESLLENAYPIGTTIDDTDIQDAMNTVFARTGVNVIVEDTFAYSNYKIIGDGITLNLRYSALNSISTNTIIDAVNNGMLINKTHID